MPAIHDHEIHHEPLPQAISASSVLETLELRALFLTALAVWAAVRGTVPSRLYGGAALYEPLAGLALGLEVRQARRERAPHQVSGPPPQVTFPGN